MENVPKSNKKYLMITGDSELGRKSYENYLKIENENINGDKVKVILGSASASEGLDFKNIREVHIMNPWHHLNRLDQVIGRAKETVVICSFQSQKKRHGLLLCFSIGR